MAFVLASRAALRRHAVPIGVSVCATAFLLQRQQRTSPLRLDAASPAGATPRWRANYGTGDGPEPRSQQLDPNVIKQLSAGSLAGLCLGVLVSVFSRTLVLFIGMGICAVQIAARYGIDVVEQLKLRKRTSRILSALYENPALKLSFGATFAMAAFMHF